MQTHDIKGARFEEPWKRVVESWRRFKRNRVALVSLFFLIFVVFVAVFAPYLAPYPPLKSGVGEPFLRPDLQHLMGTDDIGRDVYSGVIYGTRVSLMIGFIAAWASIIIGIVVGVIAGYFGGKVDVLLMRFTEIFLVIPMAFLAIVIVALLGSSVWNVIAVICVLAWPGTARLTRAEVLSMKEREFVEAARALGVSDVHIMFREILPNTLAPVIVNASIVTAQAILVEAGLSFLGLGDPNQFSWGYMLYLGQRLLVEKAWWTFVFPGAAIFLTVLALYILSDALNETLNPRLKELA